MKNDERATAKDAAATKSFFILSISAMAKSILGPVTMHIICEPDNALSFRKPSHKPEHEFRNTKSCGLLYPKMLAVRR
jgi:hypothetical protein